MTAIRREQTMRREVLEETCATVTGARLLGFVRSRCVGGPEEGRVLVRSIWRADVALLPWRPEHEISFRKPVPTRDLAASLWMEPGAEPVFARAAWEAGLALRGWPGVTRLARRYEAGERLLTCHRPACPLTPLNRQIAELAAAGLTKSRSASASTSRTGPWPRTYQIFPRPGITSRAAPRDPACGST